ncbi:winged helix DNA-binding protein [Paenarthrobacter sp. DKR-5]|uniref:MarR family winged helix-turn-helix transcriptional regulator n=1 Tax=Paenarthrobacter sp. DKR-5 TaxID=2835535 RepID=UPI001BDCD4A4|nr:MarR family transcriptional regulator [Paenarthrobacter sp. DKR-5]MBT1001629.1 winged helix DNA-binding protein [Paenarthrobacter sp. DKR-5]
MATPGPPAAAEHVEAALRAADVFLGIAAHSLFDVDDETTGQQLAVLLAVAPQGQQSVAAVARLLQFHPSSAMNSCRRLHVSGLIVRLEERTGNGDFQVTVTPRGRALVREVLQRRRKAVAELIRNLPRDKREPVAAAMNAFAAAAGGEDPEIGLFTFRLSG